MVEVVRISKEGILLEIKEVPDESLDEQYKSREKVEETMFEN